MLRTLPTKPVIYLLDEAGEAYAIHWYCSETCREQESNTYQPSVYGEDDNFDAETVCEVCLSKLQK